MCSIGLPRGSELSYPSYRSGVMGMIDRVDSFSWQLVWQMAPVVFCFYIAVFSNVKVTHRVRSLQQQAICPRRLAWKTTHLLCRMATRQFEFLPQSPRSTAVNVDQRVQ